MKTAARQGDNGTAEAKVPKTKENKVALIELDVRSVKVTVVGMSPLMTNRWSEKALQMMEDKQTGKAKKAKEAKNPEECFLAAQYRDEDGNYALPASAFKKAMVSATTSIKDKTFPKTIVRQSLFVRGDLLPLRIEKEPEMDERAVRLRGTADLRYRPRFESWECDLIIDYNAAAISLEQVINLLNLAGFAVGVGEWRPERDGSFGRFSVKRQEGI